MCDDSDEKQLLVVRQTGTTVVNMDSFIMHRSLRYHFGDECFHKNTTFNGFLFRFFLALWPLFAAEPLFGLIWFRNKVRVIECWTTQLTFYLSREPKIFQVIKLQLTTLNSNKSNNNCEKTSEFKSTGILWVIVEIFLARAGTSWYLSGLWAR